jgi:hypothetical protein
VRIEGVPLAPCRLCFTRATRRQVEACRVDLDTSDREEPLLDLLESESGVTGETLVAFALASAESPAPVEIAGPAR